MSRLNAKNIKRGISYIKRNGLINGYYKAMERIARDREESGYTQQFYAKAPSDEVLRAQRSEKFSSPYLISILIPAYETDPKLFRQTIKSVYDQSYYNWELIIADASSTDALRSVVNDFIRERSLERCSQFAGDNLGRRIIYTHLDANKGISGNTNEALKLANGKYVALLDHDDLITPDALYEIMKVLSSKETFNERDNGTRSAVRVVYSDEDKISSDGSELFDPHFKPDFDPMLICTNNYICHFLVVETALARGVGGFTSEYDGAQDHDFILKCIEGLADEEIGHVAKVLYHWRSTAGSTSENPEAKLYAYEAAGRASAAHLARIGAQCEVVPTPHLGFYRVKFTPIDAKVREMSPADFAAVTKEQLNGINEEYIFVKGDDLYPVGKDCLTDMLSHMRMIDVGAVCGKIISNGVVESTGFDRTNNGKSARFAGLNSRYSGYMHRAQLQMCIDDVPNDLFLVRKSAIDCSLGTPRISENFRMVCDPYAIYRRKRSKSKAQRG